MSVDTATAIRQTRLFINGEFVDPVADTDFEVRNPATGQVIATVAEAGAEDVDRAVCAARAAHDGPWGRMELAERARLLRRVAALIDERSEELGQIECLDTGKPLWETLSFGELTASFIDFFADLIQHLRSDVIPGPRGYLNYTLRQPIGVVGAIVPWNFPLPFCGVKMAPALAAGNTLVLKPAEQTPLSALLFAEICRDAGLPDGVVNVLPGDGPTTGRAIVDHPGVGAISFTGSTDVGREIAGRAGQQLKKVALELGGKSPNVVFADADLEHAARTALYMFAYNQGQVCSAGTRLLVEQSIHDQFVEELQREVAAVRVGDPLDPKTQVGAVISAEQLVRIEGYVEIGAQEGAELVAGGRRAVVAGHEAGWFYTPTIFRDVKPGMRIAQEEIFGPVVSVMAFRDDAHATELANDVLYGLTAAIWTKDVSRAHLLAERIEAGVIFVNTMNAGRGPGCPIAAWKQSGLGVENGVDGVLELTRLKSVIVNLDHETPRL